MSVRIQDNTATFTMQSTQRASVALRYIAEDIVRTSTPNTPKDKGNLRRDVLKQVLGLHGTIVWGKNYAAVQEKKQFHNYTTSGTGPHYAENAVKEVVQRSDQHFKRARLV